MIKASLILLLGLNFLTAFNCNSSGNGKDEIKKTNSDSDSYNSFFPLKNGNNWIYLNEAPREETERFDVSANDLIKTESGFRVTMTCFPYLTKDNLSRTIIIRKDGSTEINDYMGFSGTIIPAQDNFKNGYEWNFGELTGRVSNYSDTVKTEAGNFTGCFYVMLTEGFTFSYEMWFKKGVGIVKWGANRTNPPVLKPLYYVLKEYRLK